MLGQWCMDVTRKYTCSEKHGLKTIGLTRAREVCRCLGPEVAHTTLASLMLVIKDGALSSMGLKAPVPGSNSWGRGGIDHGILSNISGRRPFSWGLTTPLPQPSLGALIPKPQLLPATCSLWEHGRQSVSLLQLHLYGALIWVERRLCNACHNEGSQAWLCTPGSALLGGRGLSDSMDPTDV